METATETKKAGKFSTASGTEVYGELTLAGPETSVYFQNETAFLFKEPDRTITGVLHDLTRVSLINVVTSGEGQTAGPKGVYWFARVYPNLVTYGHQKKWLLPLEFF
jgi:hypothetical protein